MANITSTSKKHVPARASDRFGRQDGGVSVQNFSDSPGKPQQQEPTPRKLITYESMGIDVAQLSAWIVQNYLGNYKIVSALAQTYGFKYFFFLPPSISLGNKPLTPEEQEMRHRAASEAAFYKLYTAVYQTLERESATYQNLCSLVHIFDCYESLIWIDARHVTPIGNQVIAERILDAIQMRSSDEK